MASEATEGVPANTGAAGSEDGHGDLANQEGTKSEEEGDETLQRALPARENNGGETRRGDPLNGCLTCGAAKGGKEGGDSPPSGARPPPPEGA